MVASYPEGYSERPDPAGARGARRRRGHRPRQRPGARLLTNVLPVLLVLGLLFYLAKSGTLTGGVGRFHGKRGKQVGEVPADRFTDVAGADEAVAELREIVEFLRDGSRFEAMGARTPRGALLVGPPGTGKTLLARAVAGEAGVPFFAVAGSDFVEIFAGGGAKRVRDLFDRARAAGTAIVFIDEIDAVGRERSSGPGMGGGDSERENTLISLLNEMDGFVRQQGRRAGRDEPRRPARRRADPARPAGPEGAGAHARPARPRADPARARGGQADRGRRRPHLDRPADPGDERRRSGARRQRGLHRGRAARPVDGDAPLLPGGGRGRRDGPGPDLGADHRARPAHHRLARGGSHRRRAGAARRRRPGVGHDHPARARAAARPGWVATTTASSPARRPGRG